MLIYRDSGFRDWVPCSDSCRGSSTGSLWVPYKVATGVLEVFYRVASWIQKVFKF